MSYYDEPDWARSIYGDDYTYSTGDVIDGTFTDEFLPFRELALAAAGYMETQGEYPIRDDALVEFLALAENAVSCFEYKLELKFHKFLLLPAELRLKVYEAYVQGERDNGTLEKHLHTDQYCKSCCVWRWPEELIICDRHSGNELPTAKYAPWLPPLAVTNKKLLGEVTICMLETTSWFDFNYEEQKPFKIVVWFAEFLSILPRITKNEVVTTEGFAAIKRINFPHEHHYNASRVGKVVDEQNPDIQLMLKCTELETLAMAFNWRKLITSDAADNWTIHPRKLDDFLDFFHFRRMLEHKKVQNVYLDAVHPRGGPGSTLDCLYEFGKWIITGFKEKQGRTVNVHINKRWGFFEKRMVGEKLVLEKTEGKR